MTTLRLREKTGDGATWVGRCRTQDCGNPFNVTSEHWQTKVEVLSLLSEHPHRVKGHLHGNQTVTGFQERGGE